MIAGFDRRRTWRRRLAAEQAYWLLLPVYGDAISPGVLLGEAQPRVVVDPANFPSREDFLAAVRKARSRS